MQKFNKGDHVQIAKDLGMGMGHFTSDCEAIIIGSYKDQFGGDDTGSYTINIKDHGRTSWYYEHQLTLIEKNRMDILSHWEEKAEQEERLKSDLDWIFNNGDEVLESTHPATISALAKCFGLTDLWGARGEGITYYSNAIKTLELSSPFIKKGDKDGWIKRCKTLTLR